MTTLDDFAQATFRQSRLIYDNLGIRIDTKSLPCYPLYTYAKERKYGKGWISRIWSMYIRPWLRPQRQAAVDVIWEDAKAQLRQDFMNACLQLGRNDTG